MEYGILVVEIGEVNRVTDVIVSEKMNLSTNKNTTVQNKEIALSSLY